MVERFLSNTKHHKNLQEDKSKIVILHEIGLVNQCRGDVRSAIKVFEEIIEILKLKLGENYIVIASVLASSSTCAQNIV